MIYLLPNFSMPFISSELSSNLSGINSPINKLELEIEECYYKDFFYEYGSVNDLYLSKGNTYIKLVRCVWCEVSKNKTYTLKFICNHIVLDDAFPEILHMIRDRKLDILLT